MFPGLQDQTGSTFSPRFSLEEACKIQSNKWEDIVQVQREILHLQQLLNNSQYRPGQAGGSEHPNKKPRLEEPIVASIANSSVFARSMLEHLMTLCEHEQHVLLEALESYSTTARLVEGTLERLVTLQGSVHGISHSRNFPSYPKFSPSSEEDPSDSLLIADPWNSKIMVSNRQSDHDITLGLGSSSQETLLDRHRAGSSSSSASASSSTVAIPATTTMTSELTARGHGDKEDAGNDAHGEQQASHGVGYAIVIPRYQDNKDKSRTIIENLTSTSPPAPSADSQACNQLDEKAKDCALRGKRVSFNNAGQDTTSTLAPRNTQAGSKTTARRMTRSTSCANKMASVSDTTADAGPEL